MSLGLYVSVPFCRTKCSYCNFASDVFSRSVFQRYVDRVCADIERATETVAQMDGRNERIVDSIYLGGGTPTVLDMAQLQRLFVTIKQNCEVEPEAEITVECAPGTLNAAVIEALQQCGVNRVSLGVQSFVEREIRRDLRKYVSGVKQARAELLAATERLSAFDRPVLVAWAAEDRVMPVAHGRRLAQLIPRCRFVEIHDSYTLIPEDQPAVLSAHIRQFLVDEAAMSAA